MKKSALSSLQVTLISISDVVSRFPCRRMLVLCREKYEEKFPCEISSDHVGWALTNDARNCPDIIFHNAYVGK